MSDHRQSVGHGADPRHRPSGWPDSSLSSSLSATLCSVTTEEQELPLISRHPRKSLPWAARTSRTRSASFAGAQSRDAPAATLIFRPELGHEGEATVAHPTHVEGLLELGLAGEPDLAGRGGPHQGREVSLLGR